MLAVALGVGGCATGREATRKEAETAHKLGMAFLAEERYAAALREFTKADQLDPGDPETLNALGLTYWFRREPALAEQKFREATARRPEFSEAWNNLGALLIDQGRFGDAVPALERALANVFYGTQERALSNLGWALHRLGRSAEAERRLRDALQVAPGFPLAHKALGAVLQERGEHRQALEQFDEAARRLPNDPEVQLWRGVSLNKLGDRGGAGEAFRAAWRLGPDSEAGRSAKNYLDFMK